MNQPETFTQTLLTHLTALPPLTGPSPDNRTALLHGLPPGPAQAIRRNDAPATDLHNIITAAHGTVRFSLSYFNTDEDVDFILEHLPKIVADLREISPYWEPEMAKG